MADETLLAWIRAEREEQLARQPARRDGWARAQSLSVILSAIAVPIVLAVAGHAVNLSVKEQEVRLRTVELAIGVLREDPDKQPGTTAMREWAAGVIDQYSGVKLSDAARIELLEQPLYAKELASSYALFFQEADLSTKLRDAVRNLSPSERKEFLESMGLDEPDRSEP